MPHNILQTIGLLGGIAGAYEEAGDHRWENLARGLTGDGGA